MKLGSLCSGAGMLDYAVEQVFGAETVWHCEKDPAASKVLAHRWPGVPNHGDLIETDWTTVEPVDIMCAGWPCQPFSLAGKRKGDKDERAIWPHIADAVRLVRPRIVVLENVTAVLVREFGRVANSLATLGYDLRWTCLRASDIGAPHRRERLFVIADSECGGRDSRFARTAVKIGASRRSAHSGISAVSGAGRPVNLLPTPRNSRGASTTETSYALGGIRSDASRTQGEVLLPTLTSRDHKGHNQRGDDTCLPEDTHSSAAMAAKSKLTGIAHYLPTPTASDGNRGQDLARANREGSGGDDVVTLAVKADRANQWGKYASAIKRWEQIAGPAPSPTEPNRNGNPRLNPEFSSWMMGWPAGWVTQVPGLSRNDQLRIIGNGVVPQQAAAALTYLCGVVA